MKIEKVSVWIDGNGNTRSLPSMDEDHIYNTIALLADKISKLEKARDIAWSVVITEKIESYEDMIKSFVAELDRRDMYENNGR
jgi:hypothetical protein